MIQATRPLPAQMAVFPIYNAGRLLEPTLTAANYPRRRFTTALGGSQAPALIPW